MYTYIYMYSDQNSFYLIYASAFSFLVLYYCVAVLLITLLILYFQVTCFINGRP